MLSQITCTPGTENKIYSRVSNFGLPGEGTIWGNKKVNWIVHFFSRLDPTSWFNDFNNIKITMTEFDPGKSKQSSGDFKP